MAVVRGRRGLLRQGLRERGRGRSQNPVAQGRRPVALNGVPKLAALMDEAEADELAYTAFPKEHWTKICSTNGLERLNGEINRRTDVVGIFPDKTPSHAWSELSCSNKMMNEPSSAPAS